MEKSSLDIPSVSEPIRKKIDHAAMYRPGNVTIACSTRQDPESGVHDLERGLMRKLADAVFNFVGYRRDGEQFRSRNSD